MESVGLWIGIAIWRRAAGFPDISGSEERARRKMSIPHENVTPRIPDTASEARLLQLRREAESQGRVLERGIRPEGSPFPRASVETGYYGIHLLKEPQWTFEIPLYFFLGGASGSAAVIGGVADWLNKDRALARDARWLAFGGALASSALLVSDLGRPSRFLNMLRVFKPQSPMSVGAWTLAAFASTSAATAFAKEAEERFGQWLPVSVVANFCQLFSVLFGMPFHNYTGVLIGATAVPVWNRNIQTLPIHFGMSGLQSGVSMLELLGHDESRALNFLGIGSALWESWEGLHIEGRSEAALKPLKRGASGWMTRAGGVMSGPLPLVLRLLAGLTGNPCSVRRWAAACGIAGSLLTRYGWMRAGHSSAKDWRLPLDVRPESLAGAERPVRRKTIPERAAS
jgi:hypothetical protein